MDIYSGHINRLIEELSRLPGVGAKSAQRLAFHIINMPESEVKSLADTMIDAKQHIHYCKECFTLTDEDGNRITAFHNGVKPQNFEHTEQVVLLGKYSPDKNIFEADKVLVKCPSKYEREKNK
mgnify:CR=1 FL=1